jgi:hypothetical protein
MTQPRLAKLTLLVLAVNLASCDSPAVVPTDCRWRDTGATALISDVKIAEDLAIRHADARGLTPGWRDARQQCEAVMFAAVADKHHVEISEIGRVRTELGNRSFDAAVHLPMLFVTLALSAVILSKLKARFAGDEPFAFALAAVFWSIFVAALVLLLGHVWSAVLEVLRIGNGHLSYRATRIPWSHQWTPVFFAVVSVFLCLAWLQFKVLHTRSRPRRRSFPGNGGRVRHHDNPTTVAAEEDVGESQFGDLTRIIR